MQRFLLRLSVSVMVLLGSVCTIQAQVTDTTPASVDPKLLEWKNARIPKEYTIADVKITGIKHLDTSIVYSITNLQPGDKFTYPGTDIFAKAIAALWRQKFFSGVQVYVTKIQDDKVWVEVSVVERPRLGNFKFVGVKKSDQEEILGKVNLAKQTIITENTRREITEKITKFYTEKAYQHVTVRIEEMPDTTFANSNAMIIYVDKGEKVHIDNIRFYGNNNVDGLRLKKQMKGTKEMSKITLQADNTPSPYGVSKTFSFNEWLNEWGFLSLSKTKRLLDPYFRFKLSGAKFNPTKFEEDKNKVLNYYNSQGYP